MRKRGLTLIEVLAALVILVILLLGLGSAIVAGLRASETTRERLMLSVATQSILEQLSAYSIESISSMDNTQFEITVGGEKVVPGYIQMDTECPYQGSEDLCLVTMTHYPGDGSSEVVIRRIFGDIEPKVGDTPTPPDLPPMADFKGEPRSGMVGLIVQFEDLSSGVINQWKWDFGDGTTTGWTTNSSPSHQYTVKGNFTVTLSVRGPSGQDSATKVDYIQVGDLKAEFEATPLFGAKPLSVSFTDLSTGSITSWTWEYRKQGGSWTFFSSRQNPSLTFTECGYYDIRLTVTDAIGSSRETKTDYIKVMPKLTVVSEYGSPTPSVGSHLYDPGTTVTCSMPETLIYEGESTRHRYTGWTATGGYNGSGSSSSLDITMTDDTTLTWNWVTEFRLRMKVDPENGTNRVTASPPGTSTTNDEWTELWYEEDTSVTLSASGGDFTGWAGTVSGTNNPLNITMSDGVDAIATFGKVLLTVQSSVTGAGFDPPLGTTVYNSGDSITCTAPGFVYVDGVTRYRCIGWTGTGSVPASGNTNSVTFTITKDSTITWKWQLEYFLDVSVNPSNGGSVTPSDGWYAENTRLTLTATPNTNYHFVAWQGDLTGSQNPATIIMNSSKSVTAIFGIDQKTLVVYSNYGSPNPSVGAHSYDAGSTVNANCGTTPIYNGDTRYVCIGYTGTGSAPSGSTTSVSFTILDDSTLTWNWRVEHKLQITVDPSDGGSVTKNPNLGDWYPEDTSVRLTANPSSGYVFTGWSGDATGTQNPITITMDSPKRITAHFSKVVLEVVSAPGPGSCTPDVGTHTYNYNTRLTLQANTPFDVGGTRYNCTGWTGEGSVPASGSSSSVTVTLKELYSKITWLWDKYYKVVSYSSPSTGGSVTPSGTNYYPAGSRVSFRASPNTGFGFEYWEVNGVNRGSANPLTITIDGPKTVIAHFDPLDMRLTVGSNLGSIDTPNPSYGVHIYDYGTSITCSMSTSVVNEAPGKRYLLTGWTGTGSVPATGSGSSVTFTIQEYSSITWQWKRQSYITIVVSPSGGGSVSPSSGWYDRGSNVSFQATPANANYVFDHWEWRGGSSTQNPLVWNVQEPVTITAVFRDIICDLVVSANAPGGVQPDSPDPSYGTHIYPEGTVITASVTSPTTYNKSYTLYPVSASRGSSPNIGFYYYSGSLSNLRNQGDGKYWVAYRNDISNRYYQYFWVTFGFDISSVGLTGDAISSLTFTSKVYFTGDRYYPYNRDTMECYRARLARVQIRNFSGGWENMGGQFFSNLNTANWDRSSEAHRWDWTGDSNPENPIVRSKDSGWSNSYVRNGRIYIRVIIRGDYPSSWRDIRWIFDYVKVDVVSSGVYICTGWTGTGSVPSSGTGTSVTFTINQDSSITWNWKEQIINQYTWIDEFNDTSKISASNNVQVTGGYLQLRGTTSTETRTIGTSTSTQRHPLDGYYKYGRCQMIYLSSELGGAGTITQIRFYKTTSYSWTYRTVYVYITHTSRSYFPSNGWYSPGTLVWSGNLYISSSSGWKTITLSTPFAYNGTSNLMVSIWHRTGRRTWRYPRWRCTYQSSYRCVRGASNWDTTPYCYRNRYRPNIQLVKQISSYVSSGYARSITINPGSGLLSWGEFSFSDSEPSGTDIKYTIQGWNGSSWVTLVSNIDTSPVDLSSVNPNTYTRLRLIANLSTSNGSVTPKVDWWKVTYYKDN